MIPSPPRRRCRLLAVLGTCFLVARHQNSQALRFQKQNQKQKLQADDVPRSRSIYKSQTTTPAGLYYKFTTPPAAKHKHRLPLALASLSPALLLALSTRTRGRARETSGGRRHAPCSSSRSRRWRPAGGGVTTHSAEATELLLHEEGAWASRRARGHGEAASGRGRAATTCQQEDGDGSATVATATGEGDGDDDGVPRQLVRQAGHHVPVPEPSRSFRYSSRLRIPARSPPLE